MDGALSTLPAESSRQPTCSARWWERCLPLVVLTPIPALTCGRR
jgi:hypothetical protein